MVETPLTPALFHVLLSLADGWIRESALGSTERRRAYRLTPAGRKVALAEAERLRDLVLSAQTKKLLTSEI